MPKLPFTNEELQEKIEKEIARINNLFCADCKRGVLKPNYTHPNTYLTCPICGYTRPKEIKPSGV